MELTVNKIEKLSKDFIFIYIYIYIYTHMFLVFKSCIVMYVLPAEYVRVIFLCCIEIFTVMRA